MLSNMQNMLPGQVEINNGKKPAAAATTETTTDGHTLQDVQHCLPSQEEDNEKAGAFKRRNLRLLRRVQLEDFLREHRFRDVDEPEQCGCFSFKERFYPIHIAAQQNDNQMIRILLAAGADPSRKTSRGRTAMELAAASDSRKALDLLHCNIKILTATELSHLSRV
mmetsp:Transcript_27282/g.64089  ORF Transcript_27282/g.64089 Transcript_27282/m.64089 type:complete len:166 (-) Transcript_27282:207-704(-)